jgi:hypothetical protein
MDPLRRNGIRAAALAVAASCLLPATAGADAQTGGVAAPQPLPPPARATIVDGKAVAPESAPRRVRLAIEAANRIVGKPYKYGGGHARVEDTGYDCSGTISYALIGAGLLRSPLNSSGFMRWGRPGRGRWITVYTNPGHAFVHIAGLRLDTSAAGERTSSGRGPRWRTTLRSTRGYRVRHPARF